MVNALIQRPDAMVERLLLEALEAITPRGTGCHVLSAALRHADLSSVPLDSFGLRTFVDGALYDAVREAFGPDDADFVLRSLEPVLPRVTDPSELSQIRLTGEVMPDEHERVWVDVPVGKTAVIISSADAVRRRALMGKLSEDAVGLRADDLMTVYDHLHALGDRHPIVVLDCISPSFNPISSATIAHDLPQGSAIILWGGSDQLEAELSAISQAEGRFLLTDEHAGVGHVALLAEALGRD